MKPTKQPKEKAKRKKIIKGREHYCSMGPTPDPRFVKCYFCDRIEIVK